MLEAGISANGAVDTIGEINQKTLGPCSPAFANVQGNAINNCIVIVFEDFQKFLQKKAESEAGTGDNAIAKRKLASVEDSYAEYQLASRAFFEELLRVSGRLDIKLVNDAATGANDGPQRALDSLAQAGAKEQDLGGFALSLGDLLESQGNILGARAAYEKAIAARPGSGILLRKYAILLHETGRTPNALSALRNFIESPPANISVSNADLAWVYDTEGQILQSIGQLDLAEERFGFALSSGRLAVTMKEASFSQGDIGLLLNDVAGVRIRKRKFRAAEGALCEAVIKISHEFGDASRSALNAELNLTTLWREMGLWSLTKSGLERLGDKIQTAFPSDPLRGYQMLLEAQVKAYSGDLAGATGSLNSSSAFFEPRYNQFHAHAQRLGRVEHIRGLIAAWRDDLDGALIHLEKADDFFIESYGQNSFDRMQIALWRSIILTMAGRENDAITSASAMMGMMKALRVDQEPNWISYGLLSKSLTELSKSPTTENLQQTVFQIQQLFKAEKLTGGYDVFADGGIVAIWSIQRRQQKEQTTTFWNFLTEFRSTHDGRLADADDARSKVQCQLQ